MEPGMDQAAVVENDQPIAETMGDTPEDQPATGDAGPAGDFGLGARIYGYIGTLAHIVPDGRTTACGKQIDLTSPTQRLTTPPGGMVCGSCLGATIGQ